MECEPTHLVSPFIITIINNSVCYTYKNNSVFYATIYLLIIIYTLTISFGELGAASLLQLTLDITQNSKMMASLLLQNIDNIVSFVI